ncbi:hypothetical protein [Caulobacter sp. S45]|uniref:hypothetical protein n=1 Tax=Caulobacter sp. S45 TaxID=1641861 RepID=UPI00131C0CE8|nr:hypothetical protein [Caulobacter sp. S45]
MNPAMLAMDAEVAIPMLATCTVMIGLLCLSDPSAKAGHRTAGLSGQAWAAAPGYIVELFASDLIVAIPRSSLRRTCTQTACVLSGVGLHLPSCVIAYTLEPDWGQGASVPTAMHYQVSAKTPADLRTALGRLFVALKTDTGDTVQIPLTELTPRTQTYPTCQDGLPQSAVPPDQR